MPIFKISELFNKRVKKTKTPVQRKLSKATEQEASDDLARIFPVMACGEVQSLKQTLIDARSLYEPRKIKKIKNILPDLQKLKNQAVLFGYPLAADIITHLERIIQKKSSFSEATMTTMHNDILLLQEVLWKKIQGDGGEKGRKILNQLTRISP